MTRQSTSQRAAWIALFAVGAMSLGACSSLRTSASGVAIDTVPITPIVAGTYAPTVSPPPTLAPTTYLPPPTTEETTTTLAETTTTLPANVVVVGAFPVPIVAVEKSSGPDTAVAQLRLLQLGFWNSSADGDYGLTTKQAVMAFQKYIGLEATGSLDANTAAFLTGTEVRAHGQADEGTLVEVDKARQLLFLVIDGKTEWVFNTSTGNGLPYEERDQNSPGSPLIKGVALTPDGLWTVNRQRSDGWWDGDLGSIYRPKYFRGGIAVHGSNSIPNYPASHGCVRVSVPAMDFIWATDLVPLDTTVWVHG